MVAPLPSRRLPPRLIGFLGQLACLNPELLYNSDGALATREGTYLACPWLVESRLEEADDGHQDRPARLGAPGRARRRRTLPSYHCFYLRSPSWDRGLHC